MLDEDNVIFQDEIIDENGTYLSGDALVSSSSTVNKIHRIRGSAIGCISMAECYTTLGHEYTHGTETNIHHRVEGFAPYQDAIFLRHNAQTHKEDHAEYWG